MRCESLEGLELWPQVKSNGPFWTHEEFARIRTEFRCWDVADDDILDAIAVAITASADPVALKTLPEHPTIRVSCRAVGSELYG